jgi:hypothetical protein
MQINTPHKLYKLITKKLCYPMRIRIQDLTHWCVDDWYGEFRSKHIYNITMYQDRVTIRYENDYWNEEVINKYGKDS